MLIFLFSVEMDVFHSMVPFICFYQWTIFLLNFIQVPNQRLISTGPSLSEPETFENDEKGL